jgi:dihydropteroate synthase-like protein
MRILLLTGHLAEPLIREAARTTAPYHRCEVRVLPVAVAAFLHPRYVSTQLKNQVHANQFDLILLPGLVSGDAKLVQEAVGIPTYKGTRHAADLPVLLRALAESNVSLSTTLPADTLLAQKLLDNATHELAAAEVPRTSKTLPARTLQIGRGTQSVLAGPDYPMRVVAEITDAPMKSEDELRRLAQYFHASGALVIDVGMIAGAPNAQAAGRAVKFVSEAVPVPVSIDSTNADELIAGLDAGAALALSLDRDNMDRIPRRLRQQAAFTVIPAAQTSGALPKEPEKRLALLQRNLEGARSLGYTSLLADPLCDPLVTPGLVESIQAYAAFAKQQPTVPLLMGVGNVTELLDADSPGANALLAGIASEIGVTFLLTTEVSAKTRRSVWELHRATQMMYLAQRRHAQPKDLGLDLLLLKSKQFTEVPYDISRDTPASVINVEQAPDAPPPAVCLDPSGYFTIHVDRQQAHIVARHFPGHAQARSQAADSTEPKPDVVLVGNSAVEVSTAILEQKLISRMDHAAYLGRELVRAEVALQTGRPYTQGAALFTQWGLSAPSRGAKKPTAK